MSLLSIVLFLGCSSGSSDDAELRLVRSINGASMYTTTDGTYTVLKLSGTWSEMGKQYGELASGLLREFLEAIKADLLSRGVTWEEQVLAGKESYQKYSTMLQDLLNGITEGSDLSSDETLVLNSGMMLLTVAALGPPESACSGIAAWGDYTPDGKLVFGRNWDIDRSAMLPYMKYLAAVVFNPTEGNSLVNIHPLGNVYLETGINDKGVFVELNNGGYSDPNWNENAEDTSSVLVTALNSSSTLESMSDYLSSVPADLSYILQIANASQAISLERPTFGARVRNGDFPGLLAAYNSFVAPYPDGWENLVVPQPPTTLDPRLENLRNLANSSEFKGKLDVAGMKRYMEVTVEDGGAVTSGTVVQVIAVPVDKRIWFRGYEYSDWQAVNLDSLFE